MRRLGLRKEGPLELNVEREEVEKRPHRQGEVSMAGWEKVLKAPGQAPLSL